MNDKKITPDFIKLFIINCAIKQTKESAKASGNSLIAILKKLNFEKILKNNFYYLLGYEYQDFSLTSTQSKKINNLLNSLINDNEPELHINKISTDSKILDILEFSKPIIKKSISLFVDKLEEVQVLPENSTKFFEETMTFLEDVNLIDNITDSINIKKILNQKSIISSLENESILNEIVNVLKSKISTLKDINYYDQIIDLQRNIHKKLHDIKISIEKENNRIFSKGLELLNDKTNKISQLSELKSIFDSIDKAYDLKNNMERKFELKYTQYYSIELYMAILKEEKINKDNDESISLLKRNIKNWFIHYNNSNFFSTLIYRSIQNDYINEAFSLIDTYGSHYGIDTVSKLLTSTTVFKDKQILIEYIHKYYIDNRNNLLKIKTSGLNDEKTMKTIRVKDSINKIIIKGLSQYSYNNDLLNTYAEMEVV